MSDGMPWRPTNEADLRTAVEEGTFGESHWIEAKRSTGDTNGERLETARDLASFGLDGGTLIIGIDEIKAEGRFALAPIRLEGVRERVEQIAGSRIQPPLGIQVSTIPTEADSDSGYIVVWVPTSPIAPHMVDGRYYKRGDSTRQAFTDGEVRRLLQQRAMADAEVDRALNGLADADEKGGQEQPAAYFVASPLSAPHELLLGLVNEANANTLRSLVMAAAEMAPEAISDYDNSLRSVVDMQRKGRRLSVATFPGESDLRYLELLIDSAPCPRKRISPTHEGRPGVGLTSYMRW